jgi:hypothetical protein
MPVLVDFAHGKPMFIIHTDHHDRQAGVEKGTSTSFRPSRSNVETISQIVSPKEIFPNEDLTLISTVDSANYASKDISVDEVINYLFKLDKDSSAGVNTSKPSLLSILLNIKRLMTEKGYATIPQLQKNKESYIEQMKSHPNVKVDGNIIVQYGGGKMTSPGSYDRYTPFKNNPEADFLVIAWPLGLVQASCNPFKKERELKGVNLGEVAQEVLSKWEGKLKEKEIPLSTIKWISESSKEFGEESVGFTSKDFKALYGEKFKSTNEESLSRLEEIMDKPFKDLTEEEKTLLDGVTINAWDLIQANSGGHKCITNISSLNYLGRSKRPPEGKYKYDPNAEDAPYVKFTKMVQSEFVNVLKQKIEENSRNLRESIRKHLRKYF